MTKYLRVQFGDNDFGLLVKNALKRLWQFVYENNYHLLCPNYKEYHGTMSELFEFLYKQGVLLNMIKHLIDAEYLAQEVEHDTRGIYNNTDFSREYYKESHHTQYIMKSITKECINVSVTLHETARFKNRWHNGECAYLNLENGQVDTY